MSMVDTADGWRNRAPAPEPAMLGKGMRRSAVSPQNAHTILLAHANVIEMSLDSPDKPWN